jgi:hypothetical protein
MKQAQFSIQPSGELCDLFAGSKIAGVESLDGDQDAANWMRHGSNSYGYPFTTFMFCFGYAGAHSHLCPLASVELPIAGSSRVRALRTIELAWDGRASASYRCIPDTRRRIGEPRQLNCFSAERTSRSAAGDPFVALLYVVPVDRSPGDAVSSFLLPRIMRMSHKRVIEDFAIDGLRMVGKMIANRRGQIGILRVWHQLLAVQAMGLDGNGLRVMA